MSNIKDKYVYCTNCAHFKIEDKYIKGDEGIPTCRFEYLCNIYDCEDGKKWLERPYYKEKK